MPGEGNTTSWAPFRCSAHWWALHSLLMSNSHCVCRSSGYFLWPPPTRPSPSLCPGQLAPVITSPGRHCLPASHWFGAQQWTGELEETGQGISSQPHPFLDATILGVDSPWMLLSSSRFHWAPVTLSPIHLKPSRHAGSPLLSILPWLTVPGQRLCNCSFP